MASPLRRLKTRFFDARAAPAEPPRVPAFQPSELAAIQSPPLSIWSSLFQKKKSHQNRIQSEKLLETASRQRASKLTPFRPKDRATRQQTTATVQSDLARLVNKPKTKKDEDLNKEGRKWVQLVSHEFHMQLAQLVLGYA